MEFERKNNSGKITKRYMNLRFKNTRLKDIPIIDFSKNGCKEIKSYVARDYNLQNNQQYVGRNNRIKDVSTDNGQFIVRKMLNKFELLNKKISDLSKYTNCLLGKSNNIKRKINNNYDSYVNNINNVENINNNMKSMRNMNNKINMNNMNNMNNINNNINNINNINYMNNNNINYINYMNNNYLNNNSKKYVIKKLDALMDYNKHFDNFHQYSENEKINGRKFFKNNKPTNQKLIQSKSSIFKKNSLNSNFINYNNANIDKYLAYESPKFIGVIKSRNSEKNDINYYNIESRKNIEFNNNDYFARNEINSERKPAGFHIIKNSNLSSDHKDHPKFSFNKFTRSQGKNLYTKINNKIYFNNNINFNRINKDLSFKNNRMNKSPIGRFDSYFTHDNRIPNTSKENQSFNKNNRNDYKKYKFNTININFNPISDSSYKSHNINFEVQKNNIISLNSRNTSPKNIKLQITNPTNVSFVPQKNKNKKMLSRIGAIEFTLSNNKNHTEKKDENNQLLGSEEIKELCLQKLSDLICEVEESNKENENNVDKRNINKNVNNNSNEEMSLNQKNLKNIKKETCEKNNNNINKDGKIQRAYNNLEKYSLENPLIDDD